jgi:CheY-like chemotaxis protein
MGNCELAIMTVGNDPSVANELRQIMAAGVRARDLVTQILTFSRQRNIALSPINLAEPVAEAIRLVRASTPATIEISSDLSDGTVQADSTQIHQIVINLCHNAVQAMSGHAGRIEVTLERIEVTEAFAAELPGLAPGAAMRLSVSDTGCGMSAATMERIFDPFFTTKAPGEGTGLGLSIVQGIVHGHKGVVRVRSQPGEGTTFDLYFPVTTDEVAATLPIAGTVPRGKQETIMVVDDEPSVASYVAKQLERLGYSPVVFTDPHAALAAVISSPQRFQAIITDLTMPKLSGVELVERCRAAGATMPITIITGYGTDELQATLQTFTRCKVLSKPFEGGDLARIVHRMLQNDTNPPM